MEVSSSLALSKSRDHSIDVQWLSLLCFPFAVSRISPLIYGQKLPVISQCSLYFTVRIKSNQKVFCLKGRLVISDDSRVFKMPPFVSPGHSHVAYSWSRFLPAFQIFLLKILQCHCFLFRTPQWTYQCRKCGVQALHGLTAFRQELCLRDQRCL